MRVQQEQQAQQPRQIGLTVPPLRKITNKTHISRTESDASLAFKAGTSGGFKYKIHLSLDADSRVILATKATTGAIHDSQPYLAISSSAILIIKETMADRAYGSAEIINVLWAMDIQPYIPLFSTRSGGFVAQ